jgi:hypothetical protein
VDDPLIGCWLVKSTDMIPDRAVSLIGGLPGEYVEFTADGRYRAGLADRRPAESRYRTIPNADTSQLDIWIVGLEPLCARCLFRIAGDSLTICIAGNSGERPTEVRRDDRRLWCVMSLERSERPKRRRSGRTTRQPEPVASDSAEPRHGRRARMRLGEYLQGNSRKPPAAGIIGQESDWLAVCDFEVTTGALWAGDPCLANAEDGCVLQVPIGTYLVEAKCMDFAGSKFVSRLRVHLIGARNPVIGNQVGESGTDSTAIAVCDIRALDAAIGDASDEAQEQIENQLKEDYGIIDIHVDANVTMPFVASGFGDGTGPVFEVLSDGERIGMELEFIPAGYST